MTRRRTPGATSVQATIDEYVTDAEHIPGAVPADVTEAEAARDQFYSKFVAQTERLRPVICMPEYGVHVYPVGRRRCVCKELARSQERTEAEFKEEL